VVAEFYGSAVGDRDMLWLLMNHVPSDTDMSLGTAAVHVGIDADIDVSSTWCRS
jgi:hypothetical protein